MKDKLKTCIPGDTFEACWKTAAPPYDLFIDTAVEKISSQLDAPASEIACTLRNDGKNRVRIDGIVITTGERHNLYTELIWLPAMEMFRGKCRLRPLAEGQEPLYGQFDRNASMDEELVPVFMPPLATVLASIEKKNGKPLSEKEVLKIRDSAISIALRKSVVAQMDQHRGYRDIDPEKCWEEWCELRESI